jgi:transcriptional regulator with XRE-family HTH domain
MIGHFFKFLRGKAGLKSFEMAEILGCSPSYYSRVEKRGLIPKRPTLSLWAKRLGISMGTMDLLILETPRELTAQELTQFKNLRSSIMATVALLFLARIKKADETTPAGEET